MRSFVGIFERLEKALAFDSDVVGSVIQNLDALKERFARLMAEQVPAYLALCQGPVDDKVERAVDAFAEKEKREAFFKLFKELEVLYEIISPDVFLRPHLDDYGRLSVLHEIVRNAFVKTVALYRDVARKTEWLVRDRVKGYGLTTTHEDEVFQEVVIVHELLHLQIPNHGKLFKSLMTACVPGWEQVSRSRTSRICGHSSSSSGS